MDAIGGAATLSGNTFALLGGEANDTLSAAISADARLGSSISVADNLMTVAGGNGDDFLQVTVTSYQVGSGAATVSGNRLVLRGGAGEDSLSFSAGLGGNAALLDGGADADTALLDYSEYTADLRIDLSDSYDATLPDGVRFRNIEEVSIVGGSGDDIFLGGDDDDEFHAGLGSDAAEGGAGNDSLSNFISSYASDGATDVRSGDLDALLGGTGGRTI